MAQSDSEAVKDWDWLVVFANGFRVLSYSEVDQYLPSSLNSACLLFFPTMVAVLESHDMARVVVIVVL